MSVKFMWNGIKVDGKLYRAFYSDGQLINHPAGTITIYGRDYKSFPKIAGLTIHNNSDSMTDYFETDTIRVTPDNVHYAAVRKAIEANREHYAKRARR